MTSRGNFVAPNDFEVDRWYWKALFSLFFRMESSVSYRVHIDMANTSLIMQVRYFFQLMELHFVVVTQIIYDRDY